MAMASQPAQVQNFRDRDQSAGYNAPRVNMQLSDFDIKGRVGDGSFSTVILATHRTTEKEYAIKIINKHLIMRNKMVDYIRNERNILDNLDYEGIAKLCFTFQDDDSLYMGLEYCAGGELYEQIQKRGRLPIEDARFYAAEVVLILEYLKNRQVVHRDLKPENLLLTAQGHLKLIDFGSAKAFYLPPEEARTSRNRATSFVGTAEYVSPEVLNNTGISYTADLWALGCMLYQMITGKPPFKAASEYLTFQKITTHDFSFPDDFPPAARDLVDRLLALEPKERIGAADMADIKSHEFFAPIEWQTLRASPAPAYIPRTATNFADEGLDWEINSLAAKNQPVRYEYVKSLES